MTGTGSSRERGRKMTCSQRNAFEAFFFFFFSPKEKKSCIFLMTETPHRAISHRLPEAVLDP